MSRSATGRLAMKDDKCAVAPRERSANQQGQARVEFEMF